MDPVRVLVVPAVGQHEDCHDDPGEDRGPEEAWKGVPRRLKEAAHDPDDRAGPQPQGSFRNTGPGERKSLLVGMMLVILALWPSTFPAFP